MERTVYDKRTWRALPRDYCLIEHLLGEAAGPCQGLIHRHHVDPEDPDSRSIPVCNGHHQRVHTLLRSVSVSTWKQCSHNHRYEHARRECERRLNRL